LKEGGDREGALFVVFFLFEKLNGRTEKKYISHDEEKKTALVMTNGLD
jgi:hypothetical protein